MLCDCCKKQIVIVGDGLGAIGETLRDKLMAMPLDEYLTLVMAEEPQRPQVTEKLLYRLHMLPTEILELPFMPKTRDRRRGQRKRNRLRF